MKHIIQKAREILKKHGPEEPEVLASKLGAEVYEILA